jgi:hypothetical protein
MPTRNVVFAGDPAGAQLATSSDSSRADWSAKPRPTFSDTLALVRREWWSQHYFSISKVKSEVVGIPRSLLERLTDAVRYAA